MDTSHSLQDKTHYSRTSTLTIGVGIIAVILCIGMGLLIGLQVNNNSESAGGASNTDARRDFMFQVNGYHTESQGGQTMNMFFHYRYNDNIAEIDIPNYVDLRATALAFMDGVDAAANPYWETLNQQLCNELKTGYPIEAISCQLQVLPDDRNGLPYEPGFHGSVHTIGDIDVLALPGATPPTS